MKVLPTGFNWRGNVDREDSRAGLVAQYNWDTVWRLGRINEAPIEGLSFVEVVSLSSSEHAILCEPDEPILPVPDSGELQSKSKADSILDPN